jgi:hypothetical protein
MEERRLRVLESRVLRGVFGHERGEVRAKWLLCILVVEFPSCEKKSLGSKNTHFWCMFHQNYSNSSNSSMQYY